MLGLVDLTLDCWLEVSLHLESPVTGHFFSVVFLGPRTNAELVPRFHIALYASHSALPLVILKI
jgi:hypothetical protein